METLLQTDSKWAATRLGTGSNNTTTIGSHGCTCTCIAMLAGLKPNEVNDRIISQNGFAESSTGVNNLVNWTKLQAAISWIQFEYRYYSYDNDKVKAAIAKNGGCLVNVNNKSHWVLFIGNSKAYDPMKGEVNVSSFSSLDGFAVLNIVGEKPAAESLVSVDSKTFEKLVSNSSKYDAFVAAGYSDPEDVKASIKSYQTTLGIKEALIASLSKEKTYSLKELMIMVKKEIES